MHFITQVLRTKFDPTLLKIAHKIQDSSFLGECFFRVTFPSSQFSLVFHFQSNNMDH